MPTDQGPFCVPSTKLLGHGVTTPAGQLATIIQTGGVCDPEWSGIFTRRGNSVEKAAWLLKALDLHLHRKGQH
jgi:hypothetical protein